MDLTLRSVKTNNWSADNFISNTRYSHVIHHYLMRGTDILSLPKAVTSIYGLNSFSYTAAKFWNALPDKPRTLSSLHDFILAIRRYRSIN